MAAQGHKSRIILEAANDSKPPREPVINLPPATKILCVLLLAITAVQQLLPEALNDTLITRFGFTPGVFTGAAPYDVLAPLTFVTHMFLHGGWVHVFMNLGMLMAFGTVAEKNMGWKKYIFFYLITGAIGALFHMAVYPSEIHPAIGASGAVSGLFGGVLLMMNKLGMLGTGDKNPKRLIPFVILWVLISVFFGYFGAPGASGAIAWTIHICGFMAGLALFWPIVRFKSTIH